MTVAPATGADVVAVRASAPPPSPIVLDRVSRWYGNVVAVNDITFEIGAGITGLLGPNGAGKSTLLHLLAGLLKPSSGSVLIEGRPAWRDPSIYRSIGLVPEREAVHAFLTGRQFVELAARLQGLPDPRAAAARALDVVDLIGPADRAVGGDGPWGLAVWHRGNRPGFARRRARAGRLARDPGNGR